MNTALSILAKLLRKNVILNLINCNTFKKITAIRPGPQRFRVYPRWGLRLLGLSHLPCKNKKPHVGGILFSAEKEGFEPSKDLRL